ncbi:MAG: hypothetical protein WC730_03740 [Patescibacteria group bacterium]|jgi:hypothetical protein
MSIDKMIQRINGMGVGGRILLASTAFLAFILFLMALSSPAPKLDGGVREAELARKLLDQRKYVRDAAAGKCILVVKEIGGLRPIGVTSCDGISLELIIEPMGYITAPPPAK